MQKGCRNSQNCWKVRGPGRIQAGTSERLGGLGSGLHSRSQGLGTTWSSCCCLLSCLRTPGHRRMWLAVHKPRSVGKESACSAGDVGNWFDPWIRKLLWRRAWHSTPVFCLENLTDRGGWRATVYRVAKSWRHDWSDLARTDSRRPCSLGVEKGRLVSFEFCSENWALLLTSYFL